MRVRTLIATTDTAYTGHISDYISQHYADILDINICNSTQQLEKMLASGRYDVAMMDSELITCADPEKIRLPMLLWAGSDGVDAPDTVKRIRKHRRIGATVADVLEQYAGVSRDLKVSSEIKGSITAVWSPCGGVGKTTVALSYASYEKQSGTDTDRNIFYLSMEPFTASSIYFEKPCKSISAVLEMLDNKDGNLKLFLMGVRGCENGIMYLSGPENFDDIYVLTPENIGELTECCAQISDELIIDLPCTCDVLTRKVFDSADKILLITDRSDSSKAKLAQFTTQSDVYDNIKEKTTLVINKDTIPGISDKYGGLMKNIIELPYLQGMDEKDVYIALAKSDYWG